MCFDPGATPPELPASVDRRPDLVEGRDLVLESEGAKFQAHLASCAPREGTGVVVLPDVRGLVEYYVQLARRLAEAGHPAIVLDYFGRTAGTGRRADGFDFMPHIKATSAASVQADVAAATAALREHTGVEDVVTLGFCFGGSHSYLATTEPAIELSGAIAFYGGLDASRLEVFPDPAGEASCMRSPLLALYGGADPSIPPELIRRFDEALTQHGVDHEFVTYPGAPHSFFDRTHRDHAEECSDAWLRVLRFLKEIGRR